MTTDPQDVVRLSSPADWLRAIPYLLGFVPRDSLVVLGLSGPRRRGVFHLRVDLPAAGDSVDGLAEHVADVLGRQPAVDQALVVMLSTGPDVPSPRDEALWDALDERLDAAGIEVVDAVVADGLRWWSLTCADPRCCPPGGTPYSVDDSSRVAAELVVRGCVALGSREEVAREIQRVGGPAEVLVAQRCATLADALPADPGRWPLEVGDAAVDRWRGLVSPGRPAGPGSQELAGLLVPLDHLTVRDRVAGVCLLAPESARPVLRSVLQRSPGDYSAAPATILGLLEWAEGDGLRASIAFEAALAADPSYAFATMLAQGLRQGIRLPASFLDQIRAMGRPGPGRDGLQLSG